MQHPSLLPDFPRPLLFAHRGLNRIFLENTIEAFRAAHDAGVPGIELDVHLTLDGALVVFHDDTSGRIEKQVNPSAPERNLSIEGSTLAELRALSIGPRIPLLDELFETFGNRMYYDIELKCRSASDTGLASSVAASIRRHGLEKHCVISSFNPFALRHFRKAEPDIPIGIIWNKSKELYWFLRHGEGALIANADFLKPEFPIAAHLLLYLRILARRPIVPWTVNDVSIARKLLKGGAEGIISDEADAVRAAVWH
ncbi:MAG: glycerophosphodiester phosphodiesterase [Rectinema subterraneum]|uniref:glycerophosphodiester phosphodiesterase n=1 Tax=Rectinema subterraneum TaxID=2653714 RepID=UPI003C7C83BE